ncbi:hypothetical protein PanWU01x14_334210 [Parasponia andersonii]|uniref:Uncharacterized protein n=1 Tax=Parasponia andersonii TaxID=3476 RepID=A0A2P5AGN8_PARAD|nr:hypothetical protein PanWU01x14_334210 [Parasponia andersonii]
METPSSKSRALVKSNSSGHLTSYGLLLFFVWAVEEHGQWPRADFVELSSDILGLIFWACSQRHPVFKRVCTTSSGLLYI